MTTSRKSLLRRLYCGVSVAALLLTLSFDGSRPLRAADPDALTPLLETIITPIITTLQGTGQRLARLESTVAAFADSFTSRRVPAQMLCVSDERGAQTCITKGQLDALLKTVSQAEAAQPSDPAVGSIARAEVAQPPDTADISQPSNPVTETNAPPPAESVESATTTDPTPPSPSNVQGNNSLPDQDPDYNGTAAVALHPEIEISIAPGARSDD